MRRISLQLVEVAAPGMLLAEILRPIAHVRPPPALDLVRKAEMAQTGLANPFIRALSAERPRIRRSSIVQFVSLIVRRSRRGEKKVSQASGFLYELENPNPRRL
jgi:hypothetical protein